MNRLIILLLTMIITVSCGNKKVPFDYTTLPAEWTELITTGIHNEFAICNEADKVIIEGNTLTFLYVATSEKRELEILETYQTGDTIVLSLKDKKDEELLDFKIVWLDKERGIIEWFSEESYFAAFVSDEKLSEFPKARCLQGDDDERSVINIDRKSKNPDDLVRSDAVVEKIFGDLNNDGEEDCVIITKQTKKEYFVKDCYVDLDNMTDKDRGELDRNRRGILIAFKKGEYYHSFLTISDCFSSENENGGVYYAPELSVEIEKGNLKILYTHGRYGRWQYVFRYRNNDFELIGYDAFNNRGPVTESITGINFLTRKKQTLTNTNPEAESDGEEVFKETWQDIVINYTIKLTDIRDFSMFSINDRYDEK